MTHLDSSLLIDVQRELARERPGPAFEALESIDDGEILGVSVHVVCELRAGAELLNMEMMQFLPTTIVTPPLARGNLFPFLLGPQNALRVWLLNKDVDATVHEPFDDSDDGEGRRAPPREPLVPRTAGGDIP